METETSTRAPRMVATTSRRAVVAAGAGWVLGAAGLLLPASGDEAAAHVGADNGALGGRHGKDRRGRNKHRDKRKNDQNQDDQRAQTRDQGGSTLGVRVTFANSTSSQVELHMNEGGPLGLYADPANFSLVPEQGAGNLQWSVELVDSEGGLSNRVWFILTSQGHTFDVQVKNPWVGKPGIYITDQTTDTNVFDQTFDENTSVDSGLFFATRSQDTIWDKIFSLTVRDYF